MEGLHGLPHAPHSQAQDRLHQVQRGSVMGQTCLSRSGEDDWAEFLDGKQQLKAVLLGFFPRLFVLVEGKNKNVATTVATMLISLATA